MIQMNKIAITLLSAVLMLSTFTNETVQAQERAPSFKVGGGLGIPAGDFGDASNMGFSILGGVSVPIPDNVHALAEESATQWMPITVSLVFTP